MSNRNEWSTVMIDDVHQLEHHIGSICDKRIALMVGFRGLFLGRSWVVSGRDVQ